jgi:DNA replicative helicase MCM subunit Mcm2 (Cdc46/Mcm family)
MVARDGDVPSELLSRLWGEYCSSLDGVSYESTVTAGLWSMFQHALERAPLTTIEGAHGTTTVFYISLAQPQVGGTHSHNECDHPATPALDEDAVACVMDTPHIAIPVLEFLRAGVEYARPRQPHEEVPRLRCVITGGPVSSFSVLSAAHLNRLAFVAGTAVRISTPKIVCLAMAFRCGICGTVRRHVLEGGAFSYPRGCVGKCAGFPQIPLPEESDIEEVQIVKLQEQQTPSPTSSSSVGGQPAMSRMVEVELRGILMDTIAAGEIVTVGGVVVPKRGVGKGSQALHQLVIHACSIASSSSSKFTASSSQQRCERSATAEISNSDINGFYEAVMRESEKVFFDRLVASIAPGIFGNEHVKAGILLALLGGTGKTHMRSNIHLLMVGDPGIGKSQLLRAACQISTRSVLVTANTSSSCGLTVTMSRDAQSGETMFDAGAVVHGDGGITCIDEIDKGGPAEKNALLEVMEQQTISVAKAGMVFSMPVSTSVLAAGNPRGGRFDGSKEASQNINMEAALISRFDLPFLLTHAGAKESAGIAAHVLDMHRCSHESAAAPRGAHSRGKPFPLSWVTKFITYAKREIHPALTPGAIDCIRQNYLRSRIEYAAKPMGVPITARHLQGMIRLAEARAKAELRREVTISDAEYAVALLRTCTEPLSRDHLATESGMLSKAGAKKRSVEMVAMQELESIMEGSGRQTFSMAEAITALTGAGCKNATKMFHELNECGQFMQVSGNTYRLRKKVA